MGQYASNFRHEESNLDIGDYNRSTEPEWIVEHTRVSGLGIAQVERLWQRFKQLGSTNGTLKLSQLPTATRHDAFARMILAKLQDANGKIHFRTYCSFLAWAETANADAKFEAIYELISDDRYLDKDQLYTILRATFPSETDSSVRKLTDVIMQSLDDRRQGRISADQFINFLRRLPERKLQGILDFHIIPEYINQNIDEQEQIQDTYRSSSSEHSKQIPTDFILMEVAEKACRRDWYLLGNMLDFQSNSLSNFDQQHNEMKDKTFAMLKAWRDREGKRAHLIRLEKALRQCGMNDIAMLLQP